MGFDTLPHHTAWCDARVAGGVQIWPTEAEWAAWRAAGRPPVGVEADAIGRSCTAREERYGPAKEVRAELAKLGWEFHSRGSGGGTGGGRHYGYRVYCPNHHHTQPAAETAAGAVIARQLDEYAPTEKAER